MDRSILAVVLIGGFAAVSFATSGAAATPIASAGSSEVAAIIDDDGEPGTADAAEHALTPTSDVEVVATDDSTGTATGTADAAEHALTPASDAETGEVVESTIGTADAFEHALTPASDEETVAAPTGTADSLEHQLVGDFDRLPKPDADR